jgi:mycothiol system anti-sigma-R factor
MPYWLAPWAEGGEMSRGKPHGIPCTDVLYQVYTYLDGELGEPGAARIRQHLEECGPCLREYGLEEIVKRLVHKYAGESHVPPGLRAEVLRRLFG